MQRTTDQDQRTYFHADRFSRINGQWYFSTREGVNLGPFETKKRAEEELAYFMGEKNISPAEI